ncbi:chemotaxis protein CheW [Megalodesulfovibrio gigas]|uniref:Putative chemotaxis protein n=1 Tax=Megalodesulfovibrio gigas (strain ATCC 19364 / DSM 1382 / NCIMB 9332 / VKM B-1759) TaxID=1121448 RepID=T2G9P8_MEGG1|nr:chemotaxis protein CheW [Megalodesulfovibrio gigas]AGW13008.1 putative chemotaxis protein [Megalodesulfovibrio gigas DSM 1382 = ATCC 19364]
MAADDHLETRQFLTFVLEDELFALNITSVREVLEYTSITRIPRTSEYMRGIINVRGSAVPVIDLNLKFGRNRTVHSINTSIIIVEVNLEGELTTIGALADSVQEVFELRDDQIDPPPRMGASVKTDFIMGMGKHEDKFIMILDADKIFSIDEIAVLQ